MSKVYSVMELANALRVHPSTITYWVDTNKLAGVKDAMGKMHFTDEQVMKCLLNKHLDSVSRHNSVLYIIEDTDEDTFNNVFTTIHETQKKVAPKSVFVEDIATFLVSCENSTSEVIEKDLKKYEKPLKARIIKEVSRQVEKYVYNKIHYISELDERYGSFTLNELKSLILADADEELIKKFDDVMYAIKENPSEKATTVTGQVKSNYTINAAFLRLSLENRMVEIAKTVGIADSNFLNASARQLLGYDKLVDDYTCELLASSELKINMEHPFVKKAFKSIAVQEKNSGIIANVKTLVENGYYYIVKYNPQDINVHQYIYNLLDDNTFGQVVYAGESPLAEQIVFKLNSQVSKGQIEFMQATPSNLNKLEEK